MPISIFAPGYALKRSAYSSSIALRPLNTTPRSSATVPFSVQSAATALASPWRKAFVKASPDARIAASSAFLSSVFEVLGSSAMTDATTKTIRQNTAAVHRAKNFAR